MADRSRTLKGGALPLPKLISTLHTMMWLTMALLSPVDTEFTTHPMLFYDAEKVPSLIQNSRTTHTRVSSILQTAARTMIKEKNHYLPSTNYEKFGSHWNEVYGNNLAALAMYCVLYPEDYEAREFAFNFMDNMVTLPKWQVISIPEDEVPVAHSLTGFTTAFDFLYPVMDEKRRSSYLKRITDVTRDFYQLSKIRSWGSQYLQNHVATNYLALLHGSLVVSLHSPEAHTWIAHARKNFEKTMVLLNHIIDGTLDEGVAYGSYTARSVTQYVYLALRHFGVDHRQDLWLKEHYWFYYNTVLPNFQRTVGIADSNNNWFYGPESQLVFLDTFVLRNGHGNWLAEEIRRHRVMEPKNKLAPSESQRWCTLHTEFLWYDPTLRPTAPAKSGKPNLHVFSDWGVVTYSRVAPKYRDDTFLAFKSGKMHGRGIFDVVQRNMYSSWVNKWRSFNPGHEHPDQNMFVFAPNGQLFISDGLYGPKYTYLNNVLVFSPSPTSRCFNPWEGQLGECAKWLGWRLKESEKYGGDLITASSSNGMVHVSGEARDSYHPAMRLNSVYRSLVLLTPNVLVVLDHIETQSTSPLTHAAAFFHNVEAVFKQARLREMYGAKAVIKNLEYKMFWVTPEGQSPRAFVSKQSHPSEFQKRETNFVNVTMKLRPRVTRMAYVFVGPSETVLDMGFLESKENGVSLQLEMANMDYRITTATKHNDPVARQQYLGYPGYVVVRRGKRIVKFGVNTTLDAATVNSKPIKKSDNFTKMSLFLLAVMLGLVLLYFTKRNNRIKITKRKNIIIIVVIFTCLITLSRYGLECQNASCLPLIGTAELQVGKKELKIPKSVLSLPSVVITSLPGAGSEILGWLFYYNPDFLHLKVPSDLIQLPEIETTSINPFADACVWTEKEVSRFPSFASRIKMLRWSRHEIFGGRKKKSRKLMMWNETIEQLDSNRDDQSGSPMRNLLAAKTREASANKPEEVNYKFYTDDDLMNHESEFPNAQSVLHFQSGSWGLKLQWLQSVLGDTLRSLYVARDPRAWVANFLRDDMKLYNSMNVAQQIQSLTQQYHASCSYNGLDSAMYETLRPTPHKLLATLWAAHTDEMLTSVMKLGKRYRVVKYEDLVKSPRSMADHIYKFIGFPLPPSMEQQLVQAAHSGVVLNPHEGVIRPSSLNIWKTELTSSQIQDIEGICSHAMKELEYKPMETKS
ncbi:dermatan-sulfate epimerase-like protein [Asterias amurensis]|uniref:dermatan-sulfate epimerase-like protein n=1 Tax=Asterias amurensis TaxID=7602 RepID=UPI003AB69CE7